MSAKSKRVGPLGKEQLEVGEPAPALPALATPTSPIVVIESPYRASSDLERRRNKRYLLDAIRDSINRGEVPFSSVRMYVGPLDDDNPAERDLGISLARPFIYRASLMAVYGDYGVSEGMKQSIEVAARLGIPIIHRSIRPRLAAQQQKENEL